MAFDRFFDDDDDEPAAPAVAAPAAAAAPLESVDDAETEPDTDVSDDEASPSPGSSVSPGLCPDLNAAAANAEVVLRDRRTSHALAICFRNLDGVNGRNILKCARIDPAAFLPPRTPRMAAGNRTSSVTDGSTETNDIFELKYRKMKPEPRQLEMLELMRALLARVPGGERIFTQPKEDLMCSVRMHEYPPKRSLPPPPSPVPTEQVSALIKAGVGLMAEGKNMEADSAFARAGVGPMMYNQKGGFRLHRRPSDHEGGRLHGHCDEDGTDAVVVLNLGSCDFFFDHRATAAKPGGGTHKKAKGDPDDDDDDDDDGKGCCTAQRTKAPSSSSSRTPLAFVT